jgi:hypothetical protein
MPAGYFRDIFWLLALLFGLDDLGLLLPLLGGYGTQRMALAEELVYLAVGGRPVLGRRLQKDLEGVLGSIHRALKEGALPREAVEEDLFPPGVPAADATVDKALARDTNGRGPKRIFGPRPLVSLRPPRAPAKKPRHGPWKSGSKPWGSGLES